MILIKLLKNEQLHLLQSTPNNLLISNIQVNFRSNFHKHPDTYLNSLPDYSRSIPKFIAINVKFCICSLTYATCMYISSRLEHKHMLFEKLMRTL